MRWSIWVFTLLYTLCLDTSFALKTCWSKKCVDIYAVKFHHEDQSERQLRYDGNTPAIKINGESLPDIQLIGDFSGVGKSKIKVVLAYEPLDHVSKPNQTINEFDELHGVVISKGYSLDKDTGVFSLNDSKLRLENINDELSETQHIGLCLYNNKIKNFDCKFVNPAAKVILYHEVEEGLPVVHQYIILGFLLCLSGLFSGLNLGLMALDPRQLKSLQNVPDKAKDAKVVYPVRKTGNFLLCVLLLGNTLVNTTLSVLTGGLFTGIIAVIGSTFGIVIFGEIIPQSLCSRHGLKIGAKTIWLTKIFMVITAPIAWPISKVLDLVLGKEIGVQLLREELVALLNVPGEDNLDHIEKGAVKGALELGNKTGRVAV